MDQMSGNEENMGREQGEEMLHEAKPQEESTPERKKHRIDSRYWKIGLVAFLVIVAVILFYFALFQNHSLFDFFKLVWDKVVVFLVGAVLAYLLKPICVLFEKLVSKWFKKMKNRHRAHVCTTNISVAFTMIVLAGLIYVLIAAIVPGLSKSLSEENLTQSFTNMRDTLQNMSNGVFGWIQGKFEPNTEGYANLVQWQKQIDELLAGNLSSELGQKVSEWGATFFRANSMNIVSGGTNIIVSVLNGLLNVFIALVSCIYIMADRKRFGAQGKMLIYSIFPKKAANKVMEEVHFCDRMFSGFINGKILDSAIIGILCYVVMRILHIPNPELISVVIGVTNIIPFFGPFIGAIPCALMLLLDNPGDFNWLKFCIAILAIQQLDGNVIGPKIVGTTTGVSSFWVLFSITIFGALWGFAGMVIGVPLFAVIYDIIRQLVARGLHKKGQGQMYEEYEERERRYAKDKAEKRKRRRKE